MREANVNNVKLGDKVVLKNEKYRQNLLRYNGAVYGIIDSLKQNRRRPRVSWINHKGMIVGYDYCNLSVGSSEMYFYEE